MMIMTSLSPEPQYPPEAMVQELCNLVGTHPPAPLPPLKPHSSDTDGARQCCSVVDSAYLSLSLSRHRPGSTLSSGGQVLLPSFPGGIIFDLIEVLHSYLQTAGHPRHTPLPSHPSPPSHPPMGSLLCLFTRP